jgi:cytochrome c1
MMRAVAILLFVTFSIGCESMAGGNHSSIVPGGDAVRGAEVIRSRACGGCHRIPGIRGAAGRAAPALDWMARRTYIAGRAPNQPETMVRWVRAPETIDPATAMPNLGLTEQQARDVAAYLFTLR